MKKLNILCTTLLMLILLSSCTGKNSADTSKISEGELEGVCTYYYYLYNDGMMISNQDRMMYSAWDEVEFDYICADPLCSHTGASCTSYNIENEEDRELTDSFAIEYNGKIIIFETYYETSYEQLEGKNTKNTDVYYTNVYEADINGGNRQLKASYNGGKHGTVAVAGVIVVGGKIYFAGPKESICITEYETDEQGNEIMTMTHFYDDAVYSIDLEEYAVEEYAAEYDKPYIDYYSEFAVYGEDVYYCVRSYEMDTTTIYKIDTKTRECEHICSEDKQCFMVGAMDDVVFYDDMEHLYYRKLSDKEERLIFDVPKTELGMVIANVVDDKLAVLTGYSEDNGNYEIEYTFYDAEGNEVERYMYDEYFVFSEVIGDKVIIYKCFDEKHMWWNDVNDLENVLEDATYIGSFTGAEHDTLDQ